MPKIYESPDKGATIYEREFETASGDRVLIQRGPDIHDQLMEAQMWGDIRRMAKTNPAMKEYTDRCIELYHLLKDAK